jgi:6-bladed beta-propeller protein
MFLAGHILSIPLFLAGITGPDTLRGQVTAVVGEDAPRTPFLLGEISGIAIDDSGRIYVADFQDPRIVVFAADGRHLATIGRKGRGPGEFTAPTGPVFGPDGALYVRNMEQIVRFVRDPKTGLVTRFDRTLNGPAMAPWRSKLSSTIDEQRRFHFPLQVGLRDGLTHYGYLRYKLDGTRLDSLPVPVYPTTRSSWVSFRIAKGTGRMVPGLATVPFHPQPVWAVTPRGTLVSGPADRYDLVETDVAGRKLRSWSRPEQGERIPTPERAESLKALRSRIDTLPVPFAALENVSDEVKAQRLPETYPSYRGVGFVSGTGELWVRRWSSPAQRGLTVLDLFAENGAYRRTLVLPMDCTGEPALVVGKGVAACVRVDPESGAESVVIARFNP